MKSIEANMNALTNEVNKLKIQLNIQKPNRKRYERKATGKPVCCSGCNKEGQITHNCTEATK